jgi:hypothetical protein
MTIARRYAVAATVLRPAGRRGATVAGGRLFVNSSYARYGGAAGMVLLLLASLR